MKKNHLNRFAGIHTAIATILVLSSAAQGTPLYWDTNGTAADFGNFAGAWDGTNLFWNSDATGGAGGTLTATPTSSDALSIVGAGATGVIVVSGTQTAASIDFANTANLAAMRVGTAGGPVMSLNVTGDITDSGAGGADLRIVNMNLSNAATILTANSITIGVVNFAEESFGNAQYWTTGYNMTMATQFTLGRGNGNYTYTQSNGIITVNDTNRGVSFNTASNNTSNTRLHRYIFDGGEIRVARIGVNVQNDGNNNNSDQWSSTASLEFNDGIIQNVAANGSLLFQNGLAFKDYTGVGTKDIQFNTQLPLTVALSQTGTHTLNANGANSTIIVTPGAQLVDKSGEAGTLTKIGLGNLILTGGGPVAVNSWTGATTVTAGNVTTDFSLIGGQAATGGTDSLSNAYSAASQLVLNGGNFELKGRSSAVATSETGVTLPAGTAASSLNVSMTSTAGLVVGQSVTNDNLPAGTYIRRILSGTQVELSAMSTSTTAQTGRTLNFGAADFANTQTINSVDLQLDATATVTPGTGTSTTLLSFVDVTGSGKLTKAGAGVLKLTGTVSHTGPTAINAGTLEFASSSDQTITAAITGTASGTLVKSGSGILTINSAPGANSFNGAVIVNEGTLANADSGKGLLWASSFTVNNGGILTVSSSGLGFGPMGALTVNAGGIFRGGFQTLGSVTLNGGTIDGTGGFGSNNFVLGSDVTVGGSSPSIIQGTQRLALNVPAGAIGDTRTFNVGDATGDAAADLTITCVVHNAHVANGQPGSNSTNLQKTGAGTLVLSGVNTYTGETIVNEGTLAVNGTSLHNSTTLTIDGGQVDLTGAETVNTLFFGGVQQAAGTYSANGTELTGSGTLIVTTGPSSGYAAWQSANSTAQTADLDHDNDGITNGVEHFLGGTGNTTGNSDPLPGVTNTGGTLSVTWVRHPDYPGFPANYGTAFVVETSATLANPWTPAVQGVGAGFVEITDNNVKYTFPAGTKNFARLKVIAP
jgi:fibronectin-binding autotransporter adhesin